MARGRQLFTDLTTTRCRFAVAAGTTDITDAIQVNMSGFNSVMFHFAFGAIAAGAVTTCKVQQSSDIGVADDWTDIEGTEVSVADTDDEKYVLIEVVRPRKQYLRPVVTRGTANATLYGIWAFCGGAANRPTTHLVGYAGGELHIDPEEGTA